MEDEDVTANTVDEDATGNVEDEDATANDITLRRADADADGLDVVQELLAANDLPSSDVRRKPECFFVGADGAGADNPGGVVGVGGIEPCGDVGLLRSVVVADAVRGEGYGTALVAGLESQAAEDGLEALYLLTTTAAEFFADRDYEVVERDVVPTSVQETAEFTELCPASATCMRKTLR